MKNQPGYSWGPDRPVNLMRTSLGWTFIDFPEGRPRVMAVIQKHFHLVKRKALDLGAELNGYPKNVDPLVNAAHDAMA